MIGSSTNTRKIIHVDADSFYASVETRDDPSLANLPIAVGGSAENRGVIATSNYIARQFGVRSAMSSARAMQLCPKLRIIRPRFEVYRAASREFHNIFSDYTDLIEPLSLDEAYLDVTECEACRGSATLIAEEIRQRIKADVDLTVSTGIAPNKFLAKVASDWNKPDGSFTVSPAEVASFVTSLPVQKINGVGRVTARKLKQLGAETCGDLQNIPMETLVQRFGKYGQRLLEVAHGVDDRPVRASRLRKSISVEHTYNVDLTDEAQVLDAIGEILQELANRFAKIKDQYQPFKRFVKVKFTDFNQTTMEEMITGNPKDWLDEEAFARLLGNAWLRGSKPVRLLGAGLRLHPQSFDDQDRQKDLFS